MFKLLVSFSLVFCFLFTLAQPINAASYMQGTARWESMQGAAKYNIYYRESGETTYTHSVHNLSTALTSYKITHLKPGVRYWYNVVGVDRSGKELQRSGLRKLRVMWM